MLDAALVLSDLLVREGARLSAAGEFAERIWRGGPMGRDSSGRGTAGVPQDRANVAFEAGMLSLAVKALPLEAQGKFICHE